MMMMMMMVVVGVVVVVVPVLQGCWWWLSWCCGGGGGGDGATAAMVVVVVMVIMVVVLILTLVLLLVLLVLVDDDDDDEDDNVYNVIKFQSQTMFSNYCQWQNNFFYTKWQNINNIDDVILFLYMLCSPLLAQSWLVKWAWVILSDNKFKFQLNVQVTDQNITTCRGNPVGHLKSGKTLSYLLKENSLWFEWDWYLVGDYAVLLSLYIK